MYARVMLLMVSLLVLPSALWSASFTINFSDINIDNVQPGVPISLLEKASFLANVTNVDSQEAEVRFEILPPDSGQLRAGYEPLPDARWIRPDNNSFMVKPNATQDFDLIIYAPFNKELFGKKYHAVLKTFTLEGIMKVSLKSNLYISFSSDTFEKDALEKKIEENTPNSSALVISPKLKHIKNFKLPAKKDFSVFEISNKSGQKKTVSLSAAYLENLPEIKEMVVFKEPVIELAPNESKKINITLNIPNLGVKKTDEMVILITAKEINTNSPNGTTAVLKVAVP